MLQLALTLGNRIDLDAFDKDLNYRCRLGKFCPRERKTIEGDREILLGRASNHQLKDAYSQRVDILKHEHLQFFPVGYLFFLLREGPVVCFCAQWHHHGGCRSEIRYFVDYILGVFLEDYFA